MTWLLINTFIYYVKDMFARDEIFIEISFLKYFELEVIA